MEVTERHDGNIGILINRAEAEYLVITLGSSFIATAESIDHAAAIQNLYQLLKAATRNLEL